MEKSSFLSLSQAGAMWGGSPGGQTGSPRLRKFEQVGSSDRVSQQGHRADQQNRLIDWFLRSLNNNGRLLNNNDRFLYKKGRLLNNNDRLLNNSGMLLNSND